MLKSGSIVLNVMDMNTMIINALARSNVPNVMDIDIMVISTPRRVNMLILCLVMLLTIRELLRM